MKVRPNEHECHAIKCRWRIPLHLFMCPDHWGRLSDELQSSLWRGLESWRRRGRRIDFVLAIKRAQLAVVFSEGRDEYKASLQDSIARLEAKIAARDKARMKGGRHGA